MASSVRKTGEAQAVSTDVSVGNNAQAVRTFVFPVFLCTLG